MALSSDEIIKREIIDHVGVEVGSLIARVFPESSDQDQKKFEDGGLTFTHRGVDYGSCDLAWVELNENGNEIPIIAVEGTDALNRGSSGNAQYQRFHHALGAVKKGLIGIYYLRHGENKIQEDLYGMAYHATQIEEGTYIIVNDLDVIKKILQLYNRNKDELNSFLIEYSRHCYSIFKDKFYEKYKGDWKIFASKRSTIIKKNYVIKHSARTKRNFTDSSQRAGHIAVGEMYLTKYYFPNRIVYYLWPRMTQNDLDYLDEHKANDKERYLLRHEPDIHIITIDNISNVPQPTKMALNRVKDSPLKGNELTIYNRCAKVIEEGLNKDKMKLINI